MWTQLGCSSVNTATENLQDQIMSRTTAGNAWLQSLRKMRKNHLRCSLNTQRVEVISRIPAGVVVVVVVGVNHPTPPHSLRTPRIFLGINNPSLHCGTMVSLGTTFFRRVVLPMLRRMLPMVHLDTTPLDSIPCSCQCLDLCHLPRINFPQVSNPMRTCVRLNIVPCLATRLPVAMTRTFWTVEQPSQPLDRTFPYTTSVQHACLYALLRVLPLGFLKAHVYWNFWIFGVLLSPYNCQQSLLLIFSQIFFLSAITDFCLLDTRYFWMFMLVKSLLPRHKQFRCMSKMASGIFQN